MDSGFDYIAETYGVCYRRGQRVIVNGKPGKITSTRGPHINVLFDGGKLPVPCHPTWRVKIVSSGRRPYQPRCHR